MCALHRIVLQLVQIEINLKLIESRIDAEHIRTVMSFKRNCAYLLCPKCFFLHRIVLQLV